MYDSVWKTELSFFNGSGRPLVRNPGADALDVGPLVPFECVTSRCENLVELLPAGSAFDAGAGLIEADRPGKARLPEDDPAAIRKRILFISVVLGLMFGVTLYLILQAMRLGNPVLIVVALPIFLTAIPMVRTLIRLRKTGVR